MENSSSRVDASPASEQEPAPTALEVTASETDALLARVLRAQQATMQYTQVLAWTGLFFILQVVVGAVLWLVFLLSDSYGPPDGLIAVIVLAWLAAAIWLLVTIAGAMQEAMKTKNSA